MINAISIANFRGIKECSIEDLSAINLFIGKNNSGKSSILEALCFAKVPFQPVDELGRIVLRQLLNRRVQRSLPSTEEFIYNYETENEIFLNFSFDDKKTVSLEATCGESWINYNIKCPIGDPIKTATSIRNHLNENVHVDSLFEQKISTTSSDVISFLKRKLTERTPIGAESCKKYLRDNMQNFSFLGNIALIDDNFINNMEQLERGFWGKLVGSRTDKKITAILNDVYKSEIDHFTFKLYSITKERIRPRGSESDKFKLFSALEHIALHIDDYGDGFRYAFSILTPALLSKKRALLIEEIESHQHSGSLKKLIPILIKIAKTNDLQLFITTHSFDVWRYFMYSFKDEQTRKEDFRSFHVVRDANTGKVDVSQEYDVQKIKEDIFEIEY